MSEPVYEVLGWYVDSISGSLYLGTACGRVYVNGKEMLPGGAKVSIFFKKGIIEAGAVWGKRVRKAFLVRGYPEVSTKGGTVKMRFSTPKGDVLLVLKTGKEFAKTIVGAVRVRG